MPGPYINDETPPGIKFHATPRNAVIGTLRSDASVKDVADALTEAGIAPSTVHFLAGAGGAAFLERVGNWFTRALTERLTDARESLESGATMVGVFEVATRTRCRSGGRSSTPALNRSTTSVPGPTPDPSRS